MRFLILSGSDHMRYPTMLNQKAYSDRHGYNYRFDLTPSRGVNNPFFHKVAKIADALADTDWLFWIDDDAVFTQLSQPLDRLVPELANPDVHAVFCRSPINLEGAWTHISSGNFFLRNSYIAHQIISRSKESLLPAVAQWWDEAVYGMFTGGDQDVLTYVIENDYVLQQAVAILEFERFNTRPYHFDRLEDHFLVHFTSQPGRSKLEQMKEFSKRFSLTEFLLTQDELGHYGNYPQNIRAMIGAKT